MADSLTVTPGSGGNQVPATNNNLQAPAGVGTNNAQAKNFQPGIASDQLKSTSGISLTPGQLSTVDLSGTTSTTTKAATQPTQQHHLNPVLLGACVLFFVVAIILFVITGQSGKKHNQY